MCDGQLLEDTMLYVLQRTCCCNDQLQTIHGVRNTGELMRPFLCCPGFLVLCVIMSALQPAVFAHL